MGKLLEIAHEQGIHRNRNHNEHREHDEERMPIGDGKHQPARNGPERRAHERHRAHHAHIRSQLALRGDEQRQVHADRYDHARAKRLDAARHDEHGEARRRGAEKRARQKQRERDKAQPARRHATIQEARHENGNGRHQHIRRRDPLHVARCHAEIVHDGSERHVEERLVERGEKCAY